MFPDQQSLQFCPTSSICPYNGLCVETEINGKKDAQCVTPDNIEDGLCAGNNKLYTKLTKSKEKADKWIIRYCSQGSSCLNLPDGKNNNKLKGQCVSKWSSTCIDPDLKSDVDKFEGLSAWKIGGGDIPASIKEGATVNSTITYEVDGVAKTLSESHTDECKGKYFLNEWTCDSNNKAFAVTIKCPGSGTCEEIPGWCNIPPDKDGDGVPDFKDNCALIVNQDQIDTDKDGVGDLCDNCLTIANKNQLDIDSDGIGNACSCDSVADISKLILDKNLLKAIYEGLNLAEGSMISEEKASDLEKIEFFNNVGTGPINSLSGIGCFKNLQELYIGGSGVPWAKGKISDLSPLKPLEKLNTLNLFGNEIKNLNPISGLNNLEFLNLSHNEISDPSALKGLDKLSHLNLGNNNISDLTVFEEDWPALLYLHLPGNQITDISQLKNMSHLGNLDISENQISGFAGIEKITTLTSLDLSDNKISSLAGIEKIATLTSLSFGSDNISDLSPLTALNNLEAIYASYNKIADLSPLDSLINLKYLYLDSNKIKNLKPLKELVSLEYLAISFNPDITDITPLINNSGLGIEDNIFLESDPLIPPEQIQALKDKGCNVQY